MDTINKLQFKHHNEVITGATLPEAREAVIKYLYDQWYETAAYNDHNSDYRSLYAEPTVFRYAAEGEEADPHIILMIGADTNNGSRQEYNKFCIIDIDKTEQEIADLAEELEKAIKSLTLIALSSDTLNFYADKTEEGTYVSGDVKTAASHVFDDVTKYNNLMIASPSVDGPEGLFIYVDFTYDESAESFTFTVTNADGTLKSTTVKLSNNYLVSGRYSVQDQSLHLKMKNGDDVVVDCTYLIAEWDTEKELSKTPVVLVREPVGYGEDAEYYHLEPWQDVLKADIRLKDEVKDEETGKYTKDPNSTNILSRTLDGKYLYVDGKASNIIYYWNGEKSNVKDQLDKLNQIGISQDNDNILWDRADGFFASVKLDYISNQNKLIFTTTNVNEPHTTVKEISLNTVEVFKYIYYDAVTEELVLAYTNDKGEEKVVRIPIGQMIDEWDVLNEGHSVLLKKQRNVSGKDILTADAKISGAENNILVDRNHELFVRGTADNIKYEYTGDTTVKDVLDDLKAEDQALNEKIDNEIARAEAAEQALDEKIDQEIADRTAEVERIDTTIGSGFSTDAHETITYKFNELNEKVDNEIERSTEKDAELEEALNAEVTRSTEKDAEHDEHLNIIDTTIGSGFSTDAHETVTYKFEQLTDKVNEEAEKLQNEIDRSTAKDDEHDARLDEQQAEIEAVSANSANSLKDIINDDHSIDVDKTEPVRPVIKVNLSEHEPYNTIRLEGDGLYNFIDLTYDSDTNKLTFIRSDKDSTENKTKEIQLNSVPFDIRYDKYHEVLIITYHTSEGEKTVEIDLHDLIHDEWEVYNDPDSAIKLDKSESVSGSDVLSATVVITSAHTDNILVNEHGALYVPANTDATAALSGMIQTEKEERISGDTLLNEKIEAEKARAISAETDLQNAINAEEIRAISAETALSGAINTVQTNLQAEVERATAAETRIETKLDNEITRATNKDDELYQLIVNEAIRATNADEVLDGKINDEAIARVQADAVLETKISGETAAREAQDTILNTKIDTEISRSIAEDERLSNAITAETEARQQGDAELEQMILDATLTFDDTSSIDFTKSTGNVVTADVKLQEGDNIIKCGSGLYASVHLSYDPGTNKIKLVTSNGADEEIQLVGASLLEDLKYDPVNKELVITYKDATGVEHTVRFGVSELFNEWDTYNPSEKSAVELTKTPAAEPGGQDKLSGRVLITDDRDGDGKPDEGSDNIAEIRNNGIYVCGSAMTQAQDIALCVQNEVKVFEKAVIGHIIGEECGSGYTYEANNIAEYINTATSFNNADFILDQNIKKVNVRIDEVSAKTDCIDSSTKKMYELLYGEGQAMPECGEGAKYVPDAGSCVISAATSFYEADRMLGDQICEILEMWTSGITCTAESDWVDDGANKNMLVDVRLSHGNNAEMTDEDLTTTNLDGDYIDPTDTEFTDTNALRVVCLEEAPGGVIPDVKSKQNGIYLSNVWDCGLYYGPSDTEAKAKAEAAGYKTANYSTDEDASATNYNYMNNVRQHDPLG